MGLNRVNILGNSQLVRNDCKVRDEVINFECTLNPKISRRKETIDALGSLMVSQLELTVTPFDDFQDLVVGNWAVLKITPVEPDFFNDFK